MLTNEAKTLELIREHVNVVQLLGTCQHQGTFYEVQEYLPNGTLHRFLRESSRNLMNAKETILDIAIGIATGMEFISRQQVVHRNLSTKNILMGHNMAVKISGFGYATRPGVPPIQNPVSVLTTWRPKSVESLTYGIHTKESDIWSYGVILWEITSPGRTPYNAHPFHKMKQLINQGYRLPKPKHWHSSMYELMRQCWLQEPTERPPFHNLTMALKGIRKKKQFYPNITMESNLTDSSLDLEDFDIVASSEPEDTGTQQV
ncbi:tyrosine-protein kinase receptor Tie-1-like [Amphiura filiformis]|uniref:tyrosine-protein kinase receptor Tie-1-like n=1 Tax=Amphiura filiformis TaxID=82378 RepID=UPI003B21A114